MASPSGCVVVLITADEEWKVTMACYGVKRSDPGPYASFRQQISVSDRIQSIVFVHSGSGKIAAAAGSQFAIDHWRPTLIVNLGTCGGFDGDVAEGDVILAERTAVYDLCERSGGQEEMLERFTTDLKLPWQKSPYPLNAKPGVIVSADRDLDPAEIPRLRENFGAVAADWESAAVAHVVRDINKVDCLIVRTVSDVVGPAGSFIYGSDTVFERQVRKVLPPLLETLPEWLRMAVDWTYESHTNKI
jgi:adenosylhomocysteine nucleosidase